jgi:hypothetical protein
MRHITLIITALALAVAAPAIAGKGGVPGGNGGGGKDSGSGNGNIAASSGSCTVDGNVVTASGLPTNELINFMVTESSGSYGWVLGYTSTGSWNVSVKSQSGPTTYEFVSRTYGPNGSKYDVFASCNA